MKPFGGNHNLPIITFFNFLSLYSKSPVQLEYLHAVDTAGLYLESEGRTDDMEALDSGSTGVKRQHVPLVVTHHFQDMGVSADEYVRMMEVDELPGAHVISSGIASDMCHQHLESLTFEHPVERVDEPEIMVVTVAGHAFERLEGGNIFSQLESTAEISRMPYLVDRLQEFTEWSIKNAVGI